MIQSFTFNPFQENTYLIVNHLKEVIIVDPGMYEKEEEQIFVDFITINNLKPTKLWLTHAHLDHLFGVPYVSEKWNLTTELHKDEKFIYDNAAIMAQNYGLQMKTLPTPSYSLIEGKAHVFGNLEIKLVHTPGHSPGSLSFIINETKEVIVGDALFQGSIGRTDLPGGDHHQLLYSIREELFSLPDDFMVYSGHGPTTQIGIEKRTNPFFI